MLENITFGSHFFEIALLLHDTMLINGTLTNVAVWYNLTKSEVEEFESLELLFF
jgi:hypothetical protein